jgi:hypothetical protein
MWSVGQFLMSSSNTMESSLNVTRQSTPALVSPGVVPQPQARPGFVTASTAAFPLQLPTFAIDSSTDGDGAFGCIGVLDGSEPPSHAARRTTTQSIADWM